MLINSINHQCDWTSPFRCGTGKTVPLMTERPVSLTQNMQRKFTITKNSINLQFSKSMLTTKTLATEDFCDQAFREQDFCDVGFFLLSSMQPIIRPKTLWPRIWRPRSLQPRTCWNNCNQDFSGHKCFDHIFSNRSVAINLVIAT